MAHWREYGPSTLPRVLAAALGAFAEQGYHGTSIRNIAARAELSVPGLYHHYRSKQDILMALMVAVQEELIERIEEALASAPPDPRARFDAYVEALLRYHIFRREQAFVASSEIRSLDPEHRAAYVAMRDRVEGMLVDIVEEGRAAGVFATPTAKGAARAIVSMSVGVAQWFRLDGPLSPEDLVARYLGYAHGIVAGPKEW